MAGLRGAYPSIIAGVFGPVESGLATTAGMLVVGAARWSGLRRCVGRGPGMVTALLRRLSLPLVVALLIVIAGRLPQSCLQWTLAGAAGGRRRARLGPGLGAAAADPGLAGRAVFGGGHARLRGVRDHRRRPGRWRPRRPGHACLRRRPQRGAAAADRADPGRAAARHGARAGRAGLARRLRRRGARRPSPPPGDGAAAADAALRRCAGAGRARTRRSRSGSRSPSPGSRRSGLSPAARAPAPPASRASPPGSGPCCGCGPPAGSPRGWPWCSQPWSWCRRWSPAPCGEAPTDPRRYVQPPNLDVLDQNPLIRLSGWAANPDQPLFRVDVLRGAEGRPRRQHRPRARPRP